MCTDDELTRKEADSDWHACLRAIRIMRKRLRATMNAATAQVLRTEITYLRQRAWSSRHAARA